jgi:hypothetical protein
MFAACTNAASTTGDTSGNKLTMTNLREMSLGLAVMLIGLATVALVYLIYPGTPSKSEIMAFEGFSVWRGKKLISPA